METKNRIRMIGIDMDDTLLTDSKTITPRTRQALRDAIDAGITVLPATGRPLHGVPRELLEMPGLRYALTSNGAKVYDLKGPKELISNCLDLSVALDVLTLCRRRGVVVTLFIRGCGYVDSAQYDDMLQVVGPALRQYLQESRLPVEDLKTLIINSEQPVEKFSLYFRQPGDREKLREELADWPEVCVTSSGSANLEINAADVNKGTSLLKLGELLGVAREEIMALGDSSNDLEMIKRVGCGVAMGNAPDFVKAEADCVTATNMEDGAAVAIERVLQRNREIDGGGE